MYILIVYIRVSSSWFEINKNTVVYLFSDVSQKFLMGFSLSTSDLFRFADLVWVDRDPDVNTTNLLRRLPFWTSIKRKKKTLKAPNHLMVTVYHSNQSEIDVNISA